MPTRTRPRLGRRVPLRHLGAAGRVLLTQVLDKPVPGGTSSTRSSTTTWGSAGRTRWAWSSAAASSAAASDRPRAGPHPGHHRGGDPEPARGLQEREDQQYHKLGKAIRTETTVNETRDCGIGKGLATARAAADRLHRQPAPARRPDTSQDPIAGADALKAATRQQPGRDPRGRAAPPAAPRPPGRLVRLPPAAARLPRDLRRHRRAAGKTPSSDERADHLRPRGRACTAHPAPRTPPLPGHQRTARRPPAPRPAARPAQLTDPARAPPARRDRA